jgi:hypothetical protein
VQPTNGDAKAVVTYREIENALTEGMMNEAISRLGEAARTPEQGDRFLADFAQALRLIELEEEQADPELLTVPRDRLASLTLSSLAEDPPEGSSFVELATGGAEVVFSNRDILGWLRSLFDWVGQLRPHPMMRPSGTGPAEIPNQARAALLGDWGTGLYGAVPCAESIRQDRGHFDLLMHLGDVYYSGTKREVQERFLNVWPYREGAINRSINSNHEMYSGGYAYFERTLPEFGQESSYFALQNDHWLLVGLDVAYTDHDIDDEQLEWLERVIAAAGDRKVLLFSHHQLFSRFDDQGPRLAAKLGGLLRSGRIFAWYWGHEHRCVLYEPDQRYGGLLGRCLGHGGMPYTRRAVANIPRDHTVGQSIWRRFETKNMVPGGLVLDGPNPYIQGHEAEYGPHGYMTLEFQDEHLVEVVHTPTGEEIYRREIGR